LKIRVFLGWSKFVSACVERDKKKFGFLDFWFYPPAHLIERSFRPTAVLHSRRPMLDVQIVLLRSAATASLAVERKSELKIFSLTARGKKKAFKNVQTLRQAQDKNV
jgi:hypothetical protein